MGMASIRIMQAMIVWLFFSASLRDMIGHITAPAIPDVIAVIERMAIGTVSMCSSVLPKRTAVPDTVAIASERRNQAIRKIATCRNFAAAFIVFHKETQAKETYPK